MAFVGNTPKEAIHITLQDFFCCLSIIWIIIQIIDRFHDKKK